jgi:hypothetical protein
MRCYFMAKRSNLLLVRMVSTHFSRRNATTIFRRMLLSSRAERSTSILIF